MLSCLSFIYYLPASTIPPQISAFVHLPHSILHLTLHHIGLHCLTSHHPYLLRHTWRQSLTPRLHPQSHIGFTLRSPAPSILATSLAHHFGAHHEGVFQDWSPAFRQIHPFSSLPSPEPKPCTWHCTWFCISTSSKY